MVNKSVIINKLDQLSKYYQQLEKYKNIKDEDLKNDLDKLWSVERGLQLCIQTILDIGNHILSEKGIVVDNYSEIFEKMGKVEIIPEDFGNRIKGMAGFRNILVHEYTDVDIEVVVDVLNNSLDDFNKFAYYINDYLENE